MAARTAREDAHKVKAATAAGKIAKAATVDAVERVAADKTAAAGVAANAVNQLAAKPNLQKSEFRRQKPEVVTQP